MRRHLFQDLLSRSFGNPIQQQQQQINPLNTAIDLALTIAGDTLECVDSFTYFGSVIIGDGSAQKNIRNRLRKAKNDIVNLRP